MTINNYNADCIGDGTSTVNMIVTILFGNGNNSVTASYNLTGTEDVVLILEDDNGDIIDQNYIFDVPSCDNYTVTLTAWTNPSGGGSMYSRPAAVVAPIVLPVEFGDFSVRNTNNYITLYWETYSEINNSHFDIEKSTDEKTFEKIGQVEGAGYSSQKNKLYLC